MVCSGADTLSRQGIEFVMQIIYTFNQVLLFFLYFSKRKCIYLYLAILIYRYISICCNLNTKAVGSRGPVGRVEDQISIGLGLDS